MGLGEPHVQGHESRLRPEAKEGEQESDGRPVGREVRTAHGVESELPASALHDPKAEQNGDGPDVRDQQVEKPRAADLGKPVLSGHEEVGRERHGLPRHHERVSVIGQQHEPHAGEKQVVLQAHQPRRSALAAAEIAGREDGNARGGGTEQKEKEARERIAPHVHRQIRQTDRQDGLLSRRAEARCGHHRQRHAAQGSQRKKHPADETQAHRTQ